ncbi:MAG TPA: HlyD family secretion protein [Caulobacteraceae bacterium]|jgi:membrane fusion protein (multidrug efflux system)|nr:HlyD family secretion protein [Caulobacteraceae bacterium]
MAVIEQNGPATAAPAAAAPPSLGRRLRWPLMIAAPVILLIVAVFAYLSGGRFQSTDDAYVQAARTPISASVSGRVVEVLVRENQKVRAGQVLFRLDPRDFDTTVATARAQLRQAEVQARSVQAGYAPRQAEVEAAQADLAYRQKELARQRGLTAAGVGSQRDLDQKANDVVDARSRLAAARTNLQQALAAIGGPPNAPLSSFGEVQAAKAALDRALLNLSYTVVVAPQDGTVAKVDQLQVGSYVTAAQPLFFVVARRMWIEANFKENQLTYMRVGQHGAARIDAFPDRTFPIHVDGLSPGTGSAFALLPAENATGNWVKVTQRLPVRLAFDDPEAARELLHAGLSASVKIDTLHRRSLLGSKPPSSQTRPAG